MQNAVTSTPDFFSFNPKLIPYQYNVIYDIKKRYDYSIGPHYVLLSGSVGSAKSTLLAWLLIKHCTEFDGARALIGRKAMPDLKDTLFQKIIEMLTNAFVEGKDYTVNLTSSAIRFSNGSEIISRSWHDKKYTKFRSLELSMIAIEELTENSNKEMAFFVEAMARLGRLPHVPENIFIAATNPDDPSHKAHEFFIKDAKRVGDVAHKGRDKHTYYSVTSSNPFLPKWYIESLKEKYDAKMIRRLLFGEWLYINSDVIYYNYSPEKHLVDEVKINNRLPIRITFDFNITKGKPMSSTAFIFNPKADNINSKRFSFFDEVAVDGARTLEAVEEWQGKGIFDLPHNPEIIIHGDASGKAGSSKSINSDYEQIENWLANYCRKDGDTLQYSIEVPESNPSLRDSHNIVNGLLENANGVVSIEVARKCEYVDKGFLNTRLKENASYLEDQTTEGQDMSSAARYGLWYVSEYELNKTKAKITFF
jgi:PBSX family phage terminase large subunit